MIGKTISHYKILEKLGEGGMGVVYKAQDTKLDRKVALKFLTSQALGDEDEKARFVHEAKAAAALSHPNVCHVYEIDQSEGQSFIAMEYLEGQTLKEKINEGPLNLRRALDLAIEIAAGLQEAHEAGILHRDIKPVNIMITAKGRTKIMDFGLAKLSGGTKLTKTQTTLGTAPYMSPEQARGEETDRRTDIWSLGVVLYEMACGLRPFRGDYEPAVIYSILNEGQEPLTALRTGVPMELERIVDKALAKSPDERYQQVADMLVDLKGVVKRLESSERQRAGTGAEAERSAAARRTGSAPAATPEAARPEAVGAGTAGLGPEGVSSAAGERPKTARVDRPRRGRPTWYVGAAVLIVALVIAGANLFRERLAQAPTGAIDSDIIDSIAVLPLENISDDPTEDYFVAGMHEALITDLSKIGAMRVISRTSVMRYKNTEKTIPEIAQELDVDAIVEGSVMRVGDQVRITAQLIRAETDEHLWAENYDRELRDVLGLLSEVAQAIAGEIEVALSREDKAQLADFGPVVPEAYDAYLRGQFHFNTLSIKEFDTALEYFQEAREIDPEFASAYAAEGGIYYLYAHFGVKPPDQVIGPARAAVERALEIDRDLPSAHAIQGLINLYIDWDWPAAERELKRALKGDPGNAMIRHAYADYLMVMGRNEESLEQVMIGRTHDPVSPMGVVPLFGHLLIAGRYDESIEECRKILAVDPDFPVARHFLAEGLWLKGMYDEALDAFKVDWAGDEERLAAVDSGFAESGPRGAMLAAAGVMAARALEGRVRAITVADYYVRTGEADSTLRWLEEAYQARETGILHIVANPHYDFLRSDPRFQDLLRRIGLPEGAK